MKSSFATIFLTILAVSLKPTLSQECAIVATEAITAALEEIATKVQAAVTGNLFEFCDLATLTCGVNVLDFADTFEEICTGEGGQVVAFDVVTQCAGGDLLPGDVNFLLDKLPVCLANCDGGVTPEVTQEIETIVSGFTEEVEAAIGITCQTQSVKESDGPDGTDGPAPTPMSNTPSAMPVSTPTAMPDTTPTAMPDTTPTAMPDTTPTAMPDTKPTATPGTGDASESDCITESQALINNNAVVTALNDLAAQVEAAVTGNILQFCDLAARRCEVNVDAFADTVKQVCGDQGGQIVSADVLATCTGGEQISIPGGFEFLVEQIPACLGISCDPTALPSQITDTFETVVGGFVDEVEMAIGVECETKTITGGDDDTDAPISTAPPTPDPGSGAPALTLFAVVGASLVSFMLL